MTDNGKHTFSPPPRGGEFDLRAYVRVIYKHWLKIVLLCLVALIYSAVKVYRTTPMYRATTTIRIHGGARGEMMLTDMVMPLGGENQIATEIEMIRSRSVAESVADRLKLQFVLENGAADLRPYFRNLAVERDAPPAAYRILWADSTSYRVVDEYGVPQGRGELGRPFFGKGFTFLIDPEIRHVRHVPPGRVVRTWRWIAARLGSPTEDPQESLPFRVRSFGSASGAARGGLSVGVVEGTELVTISATDLSPSLARDRSNAVAEAFLARNLERRRAGARNARVFISAQLEAVKERLEAAEERLQEYEETSRMVSMDRQVSDQINMLRSLETRRMNATIEQNQAQTELEIARRQLESRSGPYAEYKALISSPVIGSNPMIQQLQSRLVGLRVEERRMEEEDPGTADLSSTRNEIQDLETQLQDAIYQVTSATTDPMYQGIIGRMIANESTVRAYTSLIEYLDGEIGRYNGLIEAVPGQRVFYRRLMRTKQVNESIYTLLLTRFEETRISEAVTIGDVEIVDPASGAGRVGPQKTSTMVQTTGLALFGGIALAFFLEYIRRRFDSIAKVEQVLGLPVLAPVPSIRAVSSGKLKKNEEELPYLEQRVVTHYQPRSSVAESYRVLRTNLRFADVEDRTRILLVSSAVPKEGKTLTVANLAVTLAQAGETVLVVDADLRRPMQHRLWKIRNKPGLTEVLVEGTSLEEAIVPSLVEGLSLLPCGTTPPNPSELLGSDAMKTLLHELTERFDRVLIDTPPLASVTDAAVLSNDADGVLLVIRADHTGQDPVLYSARLLANAGARVLGVVLNNVPVRKRGYGYGYGYYGYGYGYGYYQYGYEEEGDGKVRKRRRGDRGTRGQGDKETAEDVAAPVNEDSVPSGGQDR